MSRYLHVLKDIVVAAAGLLVAAQTLGDQMIVAPTRSEPVSEAGF